MEFKLSSIATLPGQASARDILTQTEAAERALRVHDVSYDIRLDLVGGQPTYRGDVVVRFSVSGDGPLFLDFRGREIERLELNGEQLQPEWTGYRLTLPNVAAGDAVLSVVYVNDYDTTGDGFHRFVDPEDGEEYVYTNFEPYEAHRLFPCFDQPDIKATYRFTVTAPSAWQVIGNTRLDSSTPADDGRTTHRFDQSEVFSTYLVALVGGPYVRRSIAHGDLELGLYARRSMDRYMDEHAPEILEVTAQGMDFYAELFDQPYPFSKYDQIFVPEYNSGAMENVGCVTYNELYLFRDKATDNQRLDRAETFLHELAHMWFGNLVTMRWWDDLWLNESFATYISYVAMTEASRFRNAWKNFNGVIKRWAYQTDVLPTTHPISGTADDTEIAFLNFDGITYGKGASVLKQLVKHIGRDSFNEGMRLYFRRHAWGNATLADFLGCLEEAGDISLQEWSQLWLQTSSVNTLAARWESVAGQVGSFSIEQTASEQHAVLRPHSFEIAFGNERNGHLAIESVDASVTGYRTQIDGASGRPEPDLVFPNHGDHAYAKVELDDRSVEYVRSRLKNVDDELLRQLLWASLWEMVRDQRLSSLEYLTIAAEQLPSESDLDVLEIVLERLAILLRRYVPESHIAQESHRWFELALSNLAQATQGDAQILWVRSAIAAAESPADVQRLIGLADGAEKPGGFELDQEMRWAVAVKAVAHGMADADRLLSEQERLDPSDRGRRALLQAEAARPTKAAKEQAWVRIHGDGYGSFHLTRAAMLGFLWPHQHELLEPYVDGFFDHVQEIFETRDHPFARAYLWSLYPTHRVDPRVLDRSREMLQRLDGSLPTLSRQLAELADELDRQIKVRAFAAEDL